MGHHFHVWNGSAVDFGLHSVLYTLVITFYLLLVLCVGLWAVLTHNRATIKDFFLAGQNLTWWLIGMSLFSANLGSGHLMGLAGEGALSGIAVGAFEWNAIFMLFVLGWIFVPIYAQAGVVTLPEYLLKRFGSIRMQRLLSVLFLLLYFFSRISLDIFFGIMFLKMMWDIDIYQTTLVVLIIAAIYTITGGLTAVVYTEALQAGILVLGSAWLTGYAFGKVGGYQELKRKYFQAVPRLVHEGNWTAQAECYLPRPDAFHIFRHPFSGDFPWPGLVFGVTFVSFFCVCADQVSVQRFLAGRSLLHVKAGCLLCGFLKLLSMFIIVMPGMVSRTLFPDEVACVVPSECDKYCNTHTGCSTLAYPMLVMALMPTGLQGFMLSGLCATVVSSLSSIFNSSSALFTMNIYTWMRPKATERELMITGRFFVIILLVLTVVWVPVMEMAHSDKVFKYIQVIGTILSTPVSAIFLMAVFCKRVNEMGAFWGMTLGISLGLGRLLAEFIYGPWTCEGSSRCPMFICGLHYLYFSAFLFLVSVLIMLAISFATAPISDRHLHGLCWALRKSSEKRMSLGPEVEWKPLSNHVAQLGWIMESSNCFWRSWDWFCGIDPRPAPKLIPRNDIRMKMEPTMKQMNMGSSLRDADGLPLREEVRNLYLVKKTRKWGDTKESPFWQRVVNVGGVLLFVLVVTGHIYYA